MDDNQLSDSAWRQRPDADARLEAAARAMEPAVWQRIDELAREFERPASERLADAVEDARAVAAAGRRRIVMVREDQAQSLRDGLREQSLTKARRALDAFFAPQP